MKTQNYSAGWHKSRSASGMALQGFSLVEVVIALAIFSISALAVLGTLSMGFQVNGQALDQTDAARTLGIVSSSLRAGMITNSAIVSSDPFGFTWTIGDQPTHYSFLWTDQDELTPTASAAKQKIGIAINPPASLFGSSTAAIVVAWPASAQINWSGQTPTVSNAQGYETLYLYLYAE